MINQKMHKVWKYLFPSMDSEIIKAIDSAKKRLAANVNFDLTIELLLLTIKEN